MTITVVSILTMNAQASTSSGGTHSSPNVNYNRNFPLDVEDKCFARYSHFPTNIDEPNNQQLQKQPRNIIIGGACHARDGFYELIVDDDGNSINYKSFKNDYKRKFANLLYIELYGAPDTHSYLVQNNKFIAVYKENEYYNVYDMENDKWMLKQDEKLVKYFVVGQSTLINDEIIIVSSGNQLYFYFIGNDHITDPTLIHKYTLKTKNISFIFHGMCIIDFVKQESPKDKLYQTYELKIILFGGQLNNDFLSSFLYLDVLLSYQDDKLDSISIDEKLIDIMANSSGEFFLRAVILWSWMNCYTQSGIYKNIYNCQELFSFCAVQITTVTKSHDFT